MTALAYATLLGNQINPNADETCTQVILLSCSCFQPEWLPLVFGLAATKPDIALLAVWRPKAATASLIGDLHPNLKPFNAHTASPHTFQ
jgi:hypothetical protein